MAAEARGGAADEAEMAHAMAAASASSEASAASEIRPVICKARTRSVISAADTEPSRAPRSAEGGLSAPRIYDRRDRRAAGGSAETHPERGTKGRGYSGSGGAKAGRDCASASSMTTSHQHPTPLPQLTSLHNQDQHVAPYQGGGPTPPLERLTQSGYRIPGHPGAPHSPIWFGGIGGIGGSRPSMGNPGALAAESICGRPSQRFQQERPKTYRDQINNLDIRIYMMKEVR